MPAFLIPLALAAASYFAGRKKAAPATNSNTSASTATSTPTVSPAYQGLQDAILPMVTKRLSSPTGLPPGYLENGLQAINETHNDVKQGLDNDLTSRGLGSSPIAGGVMGNFARGRASDISKFRNSLPGMERDFQNQDLSQALAALSFGRGNTSSSTGNSSGTATSEVVGNNGLGSLASMLGFLYGQGAFGKMGGGGGAGGMGGGLPGGGMNFRGFGF